MFDKFINLIRCIISISSLISSKVISLWSIAIILLISFIKIIFLSIFFIRVFIIIWVILGIIITSFIIIFIIFYRLYIRLFLYIISLIFFYITFNFICINFINNNFFFHIFYTFFFYFYFFFFLFNFCFYWLTISCYNNITNSITWKSIFSIIIVISRLKFSFISTIAFIISNSCFFMSLFYISCNIRCNFINFFSFFICINYSNISSNNMHLLWLFIFFMRFFCISS